MGFGLLVPPEGSAQNALRFVSVPPKQLGCDRTQLPSTQQLDEVLGIPWPSKTNHYPPRAPTPVWERHLLFLGLGDE